MNGHHSQIKVALVDDQELVRTGLAMVVDSQDDMRVVGQADDGAGAIDLVATTPCDVVLMDVRMPGVDGVTATRRILGRHPDRPRIVVLTTYDLDDYAYAALKAGAGGFLLKDAPATEVLAAVRAVHDGDAVLAPSTTRRLVERVVADLPGPGTGRRGPDPFARLTEREREVLLEVATGASNAEIAQRLFLSEATVKTHVGRLLTKLGLRDRVQAVVLAYESGLVRPGV
ncbi:response regulator [Georgenia deserti]|uniref:Response regulator n=1 Tax=Georgenia deserti TaxID=2093781 RepID=A0ABW4L833_9MICO